MWTVPLIVEPDRLAEVAAARIAGAVRETVSVRGRASLALAGGSTPGPVYRRLAEHDLPWPSLHIYFGDERAVSPDDPESNHRLARETLLERVPVPEDQVHRMMAERPDHDAAAADYGELLPDPLDLILLGIGEDGHTASLFPGSAAVRERVRKVVAVEAPKPPRRRLTVTPRVIEACRRILVIVGGREKASAVARALQGPFDPETCPAQLARRGLWVIEREAAAELSGEAA